jgi:hypothetical protein
MPRIAPSWPTQKMNIQRIRSAFISAISWRRRGNSAFTFPISVVSRSFTFPISVVSRSHRIVYAPSGEAARAAYAAFERKWAKRCPGVVKSLQEGGPELLTFFSFPKAQWKTLRTTNLTERLHEEFRRRVKTQISLPTEDAALVLLFSLVASGQVRLRRIDGWRKLPEVIRQRMRVAA